MNHDRLQRLAIAPTQLQDGQVCLTRQQQHYLGRVLRLQAGDRFMAMNGQGTWWLCELLAAATAKIIETIPVQTELPVAVTLMVALPKGNGFDNIVRCCTELGVSSIIPVVSDRTLLKPSFQKLTRWRRIADEAAEQSERQILPGLLEPVAFATALSDFTSAKLENNLLRSLALPGNEGKYICVARGESPHLLDSLQDCSQEKIVIATGPEGGWTEAEVARAIGCGFQPMSLGLRILRAVTAPIVALSIVAAAWESKLKN
ncbi:MAG: 16S rRNA (uracil(1498)-N(3))-methyltransferase [Hormoscilla sp. GM102CHS1]|nr:16S rRNA (uracil(1498)-N(3))-methyltransferase [Hormoscilla sp. GM102CHS1]